MAHIFSQLVARLDIRHHDPWDQRDLIKIITDLEKFLLSDQNDDTLQIPVSLPFVFVEIMLDIQTLMGFC